jgi:hypothetical protein
MTMPPSDKRTWQTGAHRDSDQGKGTPHAIPTRPLLDLAIHFQTGAQKYGMDNWRKGIPLSAYYDSASRHLWAWREGRTDEDHLTAAIWNLVCAAETQKMVADGTLPTDMLDLTPVKPAQ